MPGGYERVEEVGGVRDRVLTETRIEAGLVKINAHDA